MADDTQKPAAAVLGIFDPNQDPYGPLSNNFFMPIVVDGQTYPTVSHYACMSLLQMPRNRNQLRNHSDFASLETFAFQLMYQEFKSIRNMCLLRALIARFRQPYFRDTLIDTGDAYFEYKDESNPELGVGSSGKGQNLLGLWLMQIRALVIQEYFESKRRVREQEDFRKAYQNYRAYTILRQLIRSGKSSLEEYTGKSAEEIEKSLLPLPLNHDLVSFDIFVDRLKSGDEATLFTNPSLDVARLARKNYLRSYKKAVEVEFKRAVFLASLQELCSAAPSEDDGEMAPVQIPDGLPEEVRRDIEPMATSGDKQLMRCAQTMLDIIGDLQLAHDNSLMQFLYDKMYALYRAGAFPKAEASLSNFRPIPTKEEIHEAERYKPSDAITVTFLNKNKDVTTILVSEDATKEIDINLDTIPTRTLQQFKSGMDEVVQFGPHETDKFAFLSPLSTTDGQGRPAPIELDGLLYPSPFHFMVMCQFQFLTRGEPADFCHGFLLKDPKGDANDLDNFKDVDQLLRDLDKYIVLYAVNTLKSATEHALKIKFARTELQALLVATDDAVLEYDDAFDSNLGSGVDGNGLNLVGKWLMAWRNDFRTKGVQPSSVVPPSTVTVSSLMQGDQELIKWFNQRLRDICSTTKIIYDHLDAALETKPDGLLQLVVDFVVESLYVCDSRGSFDHLDDSIPPQFSRSVQSFCGTLDVDKSIEHVFFSYMIDLVDKLLIGYANSEASSVRSYLEGVQQDLLKVGSQNCIAGLKDPRLGCAVSAVTNVLVLFLKFVKTFSAAALSVDEEMLRLIFSIIYPGHTLPHLPKSSLDETTRKSLVHHLTQLPLKISQSAADAIIDFASIMVLGGDDDVSESRRLSRASFFCTPLPDQTEEESIEAVDETVTFRYGADDSDEGEDVD